MYQQRRAYSIFGDAGDFDDADADDLDFMHNDSDED